MIMHDEESRRLAQRNFYLRLSPFGGHDIASDEAGFMTPDEDIMEAEIRDVLSLWLSLQQGKAGEIIANCAWWMNQHMDPDKKFDANSGVENLDKLTSYGVALIGMLIDAGIVELVNKPDIPEIMLSTASSLDFTQLDFLSKLEEIWNSEEDSDD